MISPELARVILGALGLDEFDLRDETTVDQVPGWDSLNHIHVLMAVEVAFGIRFRTLEVLRLKNLGELQALVDRKIT